MKITNEIISLIGVLVSASIAIFIGYNMVPNNAVQCLTKINIGCIAFAALCIGHVVGKIGAEVTQWILSKNK